MRLKILQMASCLYVLFAATSGHAADTKWVASWGSSPLGGKIVIPGVPPERIPPSPTLRGTVRYRLPLSEGGRQLILRITNEANQEPLTVGAVTVAIAEEGLAARATTTRKVTFGGRSSLTLPAGTPAISDAVDLSTKSGESVLVSLFLPNDTLCALGQRGVQEAVLSGGDATQSPILEGAAPATARTLVSAILVSSTPDAKTIVALGDSITDGGITDTQDVRGWPGHLAARLMRERSRVHDAVANEGIGGNGLISDIIGPNALARFDRDVLSLPNVGRLILLEGINDIGFSGAPGKQDATPINADALIAAYHQIIVRAHEHGIKVIGGTVLPFQGAMYYSEAGEQTREKINEWIRSAGEFDGTADFDHALRDSTEPKKLAAAYDSGDHLHPSDAGYRAMANAISLDLL